MRYKDAGGFVGHIEDALGITFLEILTASKKAGVQ